MCARATCVHWVPKQASNSRQTQNTSKQANPNNRCHTPEATNKQASVVVMMIMMMKQTSLRQHTQPQELLSPPSMMMKLKIFLTMMILLLSIAVFSISVTTTTTTRARDSSSTATTSDNNNLNHNNDDSNSNSSLLRSGNHNFCSDKKQQRSDATTLAADSGEAVTTDEVIHLAAERERDLTSTSSSSSSSSSSKPPQPSPPPLPTMLTGYGRCLIMRRNDENDPTSTRGMWTGTSTGTLLSQDANVDEVTIFYYRDPKTAARDNNIINSYYTCRIGCSDVHYDYLRRTDNDDDADAKKKKLLAIEYATFNHGRTHLCVCFVGDIGVDDDDDQVFVVESSRMGGPIGCNRVLPESMIVV
jgi:hypothetical protein